MRTGNVQLFVFALVVGALLYVRSRPLLAALFLGLAITVKVWPLFFMPYLAVRRSGSVAGLSVILAALLTLAPAAYCGWSGHFANLEAWFQQESRFARSPGQHWLPSQSVLGLMTRQLTDIDYDSMTDPNYLKINWAELDPRDVWQAWMLLVALGYGSLLWLARYTPDRFELPLNGIAFCALILLQPFTHRGTDLVVLLLPAFAAAAFWEKLPPWGRWLFGFAAALALLQLATPGSYWNRVYRVWGIDALLTASLGASLCSVVRERAVIALRMTNESG